MPDKSALAGVVGAGVGVDDGGEALVGGGVVVDVVAAPAPLLLHPEASIVKVTAAATSAMPPRG
ncbi:MAG: hypothetical protein ACRDP1_05000 [Nocardioidaceae bacterium]